MNNIEVFERKQFSTIHHIGLAIPDIVDLCNKHSNCKICINDEELTLDQLTDPEIMITSWYGDNSRNGHVYESIEDAVRFFKDEPLGKVVSAVIKFNGIDITKQDLMDL